jgi:heptosyltransferase-1
MRILLVKTSSLGDVIHNLPVVGDILRHFPEASIDWLVEQAIADIPSLHPGVAEVLPIKLRHWRKAIFSLQTWREIRDIRHRIKQAPYDVVIDTQGLIKSAVLASWAKGDSWGHDRRSAREPLASWWYDNLVYIDRSQHAVQRNRQTVAMALGYTVGDDWDYGIKAPVVDSQAALSLPERFVFCLHGTARPSKLWPGQSWRQLIQQLTAAGLQCVLAWGSPEERMRSQQLAEGVADVIVPEHRYSILETAHVINRASAVVGVDTGFLHLSAALCRPTLGIYTDTSPALCGAIAGHSGQVANLGGVGQCPSVNELIRLLDSWGVLPGGQFS